MCPPLIAIINDDPRILTLFTLLLHEGGYRTITHRQGAGAYELVTQTQPALLILDIVMETTDAGWQVLDELRRDPATPQLPVLIYSAQADVPERVQERGDPGCGLLPIDTGLDALLRTLELWLPIGGKAGRLREHAHLLLSVGGGSAQDVGAAARCLPLAPKLLDHRKRLRRSGHAYAFRPACADCRR